MKTTCWIDGRVARSFGNGPRGARGDRPASRAAGAVARVNRLLAATAVVHAGSIAAAVHVDHVDRSAHRVHIATGLAGRPAGLAVARAHAEQRPDGDLAAVRADVDGRWIPPGGNQAPQRRRPGGRDVVDGDGVGAAERHVQCVSVRRNRDCGGSQSRLRLAERGDRQRVAHRAGARVDHAHAIGVAVGHVQAAVGLVEGDAGGVATDARRSASPCRCARPPASRCPARRCRGRRSARVRRGGRSTGVADRAAPAGRAPPRLVTQAVAPSARVRPRPAPRRAAPSG